MKQALILAGGEGLRLKGNITVPKPFLELKDGLTLLDYQIQWLGKYFDEIIICCPSSFMTQMKYEASSLLFAKDYPVFNYSIEHTKLGTGGAVKNALSRISANKIYVMNVDDILLDYDPLELYEYADRGVGITAAKARLPFARITTYNSLVLRYEQKPEIDIWVSTGHYVFKKYVIERYFPAVGDLEYQVMQGLADKRKIRMQKFNGIWLTINTIKDLMYAREVLER